MYQYKHRKMNYDEFVVAYQAYLDKHGYDFNHKLFSQEWHYYQKGKSWFAATIDYQLEQGVDPDTLKVTSLKDE